MLSPSSFDPNMFMFCVATFKEGLCLLMLFLCAQCSIRGMFQQGYSKISSIDLNIRLVFSLSSSVMYILKLTMLPIFTPAENTYKSPPFTATRCLQMKRPMPILFSAKSVFLSKLQENWASSSGLKPIPVSKTWTSSFFDCLLQAAAMLMAPCLMFFIAFCRRLIMTCRKRS